MSPQLPIDQNVKLSRREQQVAELIQAGHTDQQMAEQLQISKHTVNSYTKSLFKKLNIRKRSAVASALAAPAPEAPRLEDAA